MSSLNRALFFSFAGKYSSMLIQFIAVMVISRVLTPDDIGGYSLALGSVAIGQVLRDFGLSLYLVKEKDISDEKVQGCFTISIFICWSLALVYFFSAPYIGEFFQKESIVTLTKILAFNFLIIPFGTFTLSLLKRRMQFDKIMYIDVSSSVISAISSIVLIMAYKTVEVLALASVLGTVTTVLFTFKYTTWRYFKINFSKLVEIAKFSGFVSGANILNELRNIIPEFLIGRLSSLEDVAFLSKANGVINLFSKLLSGAIAPVLQPYLAKIHNESGNIEKNIYQVTHYMLAFQWPFCSFVYVFSEEIILLLYGHQWEVVIPLIKICCILFFIDGLAVLGVQMLNSVGDVKYVLRLSLIATLLRILFVILFIDFGLYSLLLSFLVLAVIRVVLLLNRYKSFLNVSFRKLFVVYRLNAGIALSTLLACYLCHVSLNSVTSNILILGVSSLVFTLTWLFSLTLFKHPLSFKLVNMWNNYAKR